MRVLVVGGSGYVAGLILPLLARRHAIRVLDRRPAPDGVEYLAGSATDYADLRRAAEGVDAVVHCAMGSTDWDTPAAAADAYDMNVKSVHLTLLAARDAGVCHAVHISSLSVYRDLTARRLDESVPPDATDLYGLTKRLGEQVCLAAGAEWGMSVNILRLAWPTPDDAWPAWGGPQPPELRHAADGTLIEATAATDLAAAVLAALDHRDGVQRFVISGDGSARLWSTDKARQVLGWTPTFRAGPFVPPEFAVPRLLVHPHFRLVPLGPEHNDRDHRAWTSSMEHIHRTPGFEKHDWPHPMTPAENLRDLRQHAEDFQQRTGFTYSVTAGDDVLGCVYIYPSQRRGWAAVRSWVREDRADLDVPLHAAVSEWLQRDWPFAGFTYAPRP